jgi:hypothetical protein
MVSLRGLSVSGYRHAPCSLVRIFARHQRIASCSPAAEKMETGPQLAANADRPSRSPAAASTMGDSAPHAASRQKDIA